MKSGVDKRKVWDSKVANAAMIYIGLIFLFMLPILFDPLAWHSFTQLGCSILTFGLGIYLLWILIQFRVEMKEKRDKIGYLILTIIFLSGGISIFLLIPFINSQITPEIVAFIKPTVLRLDSVIYWILGAGAGVCFVGTGIYLVYKNHQSWITLLFFLSFTCFGIGWITFAYYNQIGCQCPQLLILVYVIFYIFIYTGTIILAHACRLLVTPNHIYFHPSIYVISYISYFTTIVLLLTSQTHSQVIMYFGVLYVAREHSLVVSIIYSVSLLLPLGYSIYRLSYYPDWLTRKRREWIKRIRTGLVFFIPFYLIEALAGVRPIELLQESISPYNPLPRYMLLLVISLFCLFYSVIIINSGLPDVSKWFFEEVKLRAVLEVGDLSPQLNLTAIWRKLDDWEKNDNLSPKKMDGKSLQEYIKVAKTLILDEGIKLPRI